MLSAISSVKRNDRAATASQQCTFPISIRTTVPFTLKGDRSSDCRIAPLRLEIKAGDIIGLVGRSGVGKSTLLKLLAGYYTVNTQTNEGIEYSEHQAKRIKTEFAVTPQTQRRAQYVAQDPENYLFSHLTVGAHLRLPDKGVSADDLMERMKLGKLYDVAGKRVYQLSGGEKRRLALAVALACDPVLLLIDETLSSLDMQTRHEVFSYLKEWIDSSGRALILVSHELRDVHKYCNRHWHLHYGESDAADNQALVAELPLHERYEHFEVEVMSRLNGDQSNWGQTGESSN